MSTTRNNSSYADADVEYQCIRTNRYFGPTCRISNYNRIFDSTQREIEKIIIIIINIINDYNNN